MNSKHSETTHLRQAVTLHLSKDFMPKLASICQTAKFGEDILMAELLQFLEDFSDQYCCFDLVKPPNVSGVTASYAWYQIMSFGISGGELYTG